MICSSPPKPTVGPRAGREICPGEGGSRAGRAAEHLGDGALPRCCDRERTGATRISSRRYERRSLDDAPRMLRTSPLRVSGPNQARITGLRGRRLSKAIRVNAGEACAQAVHDRRLKRLLKSQNARMSSVTKANTHAPTACNLEGLLNEHTPRTPGRGCSE